MTSYGAKPKAPSRRPRLKQRQYRHGSNVDEQLSLLSSMEHDAAVQNYQRGDKDDDSFDLPPIDAFPTFERAKEMQEECKRPRDDDFVDAATFLQTDELSGDNRRLIDEEEKWEQMDASCRPSDFFERKSRNLDRVELSSPGNRDDPMFQDDEVTPQQQLSPTDIGQGVAFHDRFDRNSGFSGSGTAFSSGYEVHFDNARRTYTPNSLKYLQKKSRLRNDSKRCDTNRSDHTIADHSGEADKVTRKAYPLADQEIPEDPSVAYVATLQCGPGVIKEAMHEIDALIENSIQSASSPLAKKTLGVGLFDYISEFDRDYERPVESMLPLSRTTDSWGEDTSISQIDDDVRRQSRGLDSLCCGIEHTTNGVGRSRSQEISELDTIREVPCLSNADYQSQQSADSCKSYSRALHLRAQSNLDPFDDGAHERRVDNIQNSYDEANHFSGKRLSGETSRRWDGLKSRMTSATLDQSLPTVTNIQNPFREETHVSNSDRISDGMPGDVISGRLDNNVDSKRNPDSRVRVNTQLDDVDPNSVRFRYEENDCQSRGATRREHDDDQHQKCTGFESRNARIAALKQAAASGNLRDVPNHKKLHVAMDAAMIPRRCRRFLCSVGDVMTEQVVFTNGTESVGRICVSLLALSTGCQQFSVSPAVLELRPQTSSAFHITFNARYTGAVSGIFQFRGVGIDELFHPYEVVIEASVKRELELEAPSSSRATQQRRETDAISDRVQEQASSTVDQVAVTPTSIRFDCVRSKSGEKVLRKAKLRLVNNSAQTLPFKVRAPENVSVSPAYAMIQPASEVSVSVLPISQPLSQHQCGESRCAHSSSKAEDWLCTLTVRVGKTYLREVKVLVDRRAIQLLPPFDEIARSRHQLSSQTDSFYYTKHGKRRNLYFHARAVEFGCCNVGGSHEVPVYVCNGSKAPMTVFLQELQEPFSCAFSSTTIEPRKFIKVMVAFTPKVVGKVATSLFAYSLTEKAVLTLIARGT